MPLEQKTLDFLKSNDESQPFLRVTGKGWGFEELVAFSVALLKNQTVTALDLSNNKLSALNLRVLLAGLNQNPRIQSLVLSNNQGKITADTIRLLLDHPSLTHLDLTENDLTEEALSALLVGLKHNKTIAFLHLGKNPMTANSIQALQDLLEANQTLKHLDLSYYKADPQVFRPLLEPLLSHPALTHLELAGARLDAEMMEILSDKLANNKTLVYLNLIGNALDQAVMDALGEALKVNDTLTQLDLSDNPLCLVALIAFLEGLKDNKTLKTLGLNHSVLDLAGVQRLASMLEVNQTLTHLYLADNAINITGLRCLLSALKKNQALETLDLSRNAFLKVPDSEAEHLKELHMDKKLERYQAEMARSVTERLESWVTERSLLQQEILDVFDKNKTLRELLLDSSQFEPGFLTRLNENLSENRSLFLKQQCFAAVLQAREQASLAARQDSSSTLFARTPPEGDSGEHTRTQSQASQRGLGSGSP